MALHPDFGYFDEGADLTDPGLYRSARRSFGEASVLPPLAYRSKVFSDLEDEKIWSRGWVAVGTLQEIPKAGDLLPFTIGNHGIHVQRNEDGSLTGRFNKAQHGGCRAVPLQCQTGSKTKCSFTSCGYSRDRDVIPADDLGDGTPAMHQYLGLVPERLLPVKVETWGPFIFANLAQRSGSLREELSDLPDRIGDFLECASVLGAKGWLEIRSNWKLAGSALLGPRDPVSSAGGSESTSCNSGQRRSYVLETLKLSDARLSHAYNVALPHLAGLSSDQLRHGAFYRVFPNLLLALLPSHVVSVIMQPLSMTETLLRVCLLADEAGSEKAVGGAKRLHDAWLAAIRQNAVRAESFQKLATAWGTASQPETQNLPLPVDDYPGGCEIQQFVIEKILEEHESYWNGPLYGRV